MSEPWKDHLGNVYPRTKLKVHACCLGIYVAVENFNVQLHLGSIKDQKFIWSLMLLCSRLAEVGIHLNTAIMMQPWWIYVAYAGELSFRFKGSHMDGGPTREELDKMLVVLNQLNKEELFEFVVIDQLDLGRHLPLGD